MIEKSTREPGFEQHLHRRVMEIWLLPEERRERYALTLGELMDLKAEYDARLNWQ